MPTPPSDDPTGRPFSAKRVPEGSGDAPKEGAVAGPPAHASPVNSSGSTDSHHPGKHDISDFVLKTGSSRKSSDILHILTNPGSNTNDKPAPALGVHVNTDDAPTVITQNRQPQTHVPLIATPGQQVIANRRLGHFELIEAIGAGGMAAVLKARDLELGRIVALKILPPEAARDPESITRFKQEARAAAMLDHENVARAYFCGEDQGLHFIAFEFVEGINLRTMIERRGTVPAADCIRYMIQVAAGLNHAAERGVVHRDIKPSNIIITPDGRAKIVDMGLARHLDSLAVNGGVTQSGVTLGTFDYISPEQALDPRQADVRSDIYSLGCTFYHALTGRPPVPEGTAAKKLQAHQHVDPLDPRLLNPSIPDGLAAILSGMMAKNPNQRFQTPTDLIAHLKGLMEQLKLAGDVVPSDSVVKGVPASQSGFAEAPKLRLGWLLAAAAAALAIAAFAMSSGDSGSPRVQPPWITESASSRENTSLQNAGGVSAIGPNAEESPEKIQTVQQLVEALAKPSTKTQKIHLAAGKFDLQPYKDLISAPGKEIELIGATNGTTEIGLAASPHGNLTLRADSVSIRDIRFVIHPCPLNADGLDGVNHPFGLAIQANNPVSIQDCVFFTPSAQEEEATAISVSCGAELASSKLSITRCAFAQMDIGIQVPARWDVAIEDSGFAARKSAIQIIAAKNDEAEPGETRTPVKLSRSSFILEPRAAVVEASGAADITAITAGYCVFAAVGKAQEKTPDNPFGSILSIAKPKADGRYLFSYAGLGGQKNAYYRVNPLTISLGDVQTLSFEECKTLKLPIEDNQAVQLAKRPWAKPNPFDSFEREPWSSFGLAINEEPAVFVKDDPTVIGVQFHNDSDILHIRRRAYANVVKSWPPAKPVSSEQAQKVWWPHPRDGELAPPGTNTNTDLVQLLRHARPDEVILIKHDGLLRMPETIDLKPRAGSTEFKVTFKPYGDCTPVLTTPQGVNLPLEQSLFRLIGGEVTFDGLQFLLKPPARNNPFKVSALTILGGKSCTFNECVFTLAQDSDDQFVSAVRVADPDKVMMAMAEGASRPIPEILLKQCIIRGKGRGLWVEANRAIKLEMSQSLAAIDGPMVMTEPAEKPMASAKSSLKLHRVTAFVGGPLVEMKAGKSVLVPFEVHTEECLFAGVPSSGLPMVELNGIDPADVKSALEWHVVKNGNRYANFEEGTVAMIVRPGEGMNAKEWSWNDWFGFASEPPGKPLMKLMFASAPTALRDLAAIKPKDIAFPDTTEMKMEDAGANLKFLPVPWSMR